MFVSCQKYGVRNRRGKGISALAVSTFLSLAIAAAQTAPGVRGGASAAGGAINALSSKQSKIFTDALDIFQEVGSVTATVPGTEAGLGPRFNLDGCAGCHVQPAVGGSSPAVNPQ